MKIFNYEIGRIKTASQKQLGRSNSMIGTYNRFGLGFAIDEFDLFSQIKGYRTDLLNGTNWRPVDPVQVNNFEYINFLRILSKYSVSIFNDYIILGHAIFARIEGQLFYISRNNYTWNVEKTTIRNYPNAEVFEFDEPNVFSGERTISYKCEPYSSLYNIALSCQKNGMSKSGFVTMISPKTPSGVNSIARLNDVDRAELEKSISEQHGVSNDSQSNILIFNNEMNVNTITFDSTKLGILDTKKLCEEYICSKLGVPYVLLPSEGQTFANYEEANKILYENHSKYCEYFANFAKRELKLDIDYKTIAETGKGIV
jgi:hypothetical protein